MPIIILIILLVCGFIGSGMAKSRGKDPTAWFFICFLTGIIGIIILAVSGSPAVATENASHSYAATPARAALSQGAGAIDLKRWRTLVELDPDIAAAAKIARDKSDICERLLAEKYLVLNDKTYLQAALDRALADSTEIEEAAALAAANAKVKVVTDPDGLTGTVTFPNGASSFKKTPDGRYKIVSGAFVGYSYNNLEAMVANFETMF